MAKAAAKEYFRENMSVEEYRKACEAFWADHYSGGKNGKGYNDACQELHEACHAKKLPTPLWARMQLEPEETVIPAPPELRKELDEIDKEFGVKNGKREKPPTPEEFERSYQEFMKTIEKVEAKEKAEAEAKAAAIA